MKLTKQLATRLGIGAAIAAVLVGGGFYAFHQTRYKVSAEEAQAIALKNAGVRPSEATFMRVEKDMDDWHATYDIEFYTDKGDFDYVIDAETGSILERDHANAPTQEVPVETTNSEATVKETSTAPATGSQAETQMISADEAKQKALADAGLTESAVSQLIVQLDTDNGQPFYEVDFNDTATQLDYDYTIDARTGAIVERSQEPLLD